MFARCPLHLGAPRSNLLRLASRPATLGFQLRLRALAARSTTAANLQHAQPAVEAPPVVPYDVQAINRVVVTGTVLTQPTFYSFTANQYLTHFRLGLRPRVYRAGLPQPRQGAVSVDAHGLLALQLWQHVRKGDEVQVEGVLREDSWTDKASGLPRRAVKVIAEGLGLVAPSEQASADAPPGRPELEDEQHSHYHLPAWPGEGPQPQALRPPAQRRPTQPRPPVTGSAQTSVFMFESMGKSFGEIAAARGIKEATVHQHLLTALEEGQTTCWARLASSLQLGPPGSATWLSAPDIIGAAIAAEQEQGAQVAQLPLRAIRAQLERQPGTAAKVAASLAAGGGDPALLYGAIRLVLLMMAKEIDISLISEPPVRPPPAGAAPLQQPPF